MKTKKRKRIAAPLKWHGGKYYLARKLIELMPTKPAPLHVGEPYFGGGQFLFCRDPTETSEFICDTNQHLTNFWRVLQSPVLFSRFYRRISAMPFSKKEFDAAAKYLATPVAHLRPRELRRSRVDRAAAFFVVARQSRQGLQRDFATLTRRRTRAGMNEQASAWISTVDGLPKVHARLRGVVILDGNALDVIRREDDKRTFYYLDPPYVHETRSTIDEYGAHEMSLAEHVALLETLACIAGRFMLSGYRNPDYDAAARVHGWYRLDFELPNNAASGGIKDRKIESIWANYRFAHGDAVKCDSEQT